MQGREIGGGEVTILNQSDKAKWWQATVVFCTFLVSAVAQEAVRPEIRGQPILPRGTNESAETRKRRFPKPDPLQIRMIKNRLSGREQMADGFPTLSPTNVVKLVEDPSSEGKLDAKGYRQTSFATLAGFPFELTDAVANGSADPAAAKHATLAQIPESVQRLDGLKIAIRGFLVPLKMDEGKTVEFLLMRDQTLCCFGSIPKPHQWITVKASNGPKPIMDQPVTVYGKLSVGDHREGGFLIGVYSMEADRVQEP